MQNITTTGTDNSHLAGGTTGVTTPATMTDMGVTAQPTTANPNVTGTGLSLKGYDRSKIYFESLLQDPLTNNKNLIEPIEVDSNKAKYAGDKFFVKAKPAGDVGKAADSVTMEYIQALQGVAIEGNGNMYTGQEETKRVKYITVFANDSARPLSSFGFGIDKLGQDYWKMNDSDRKLLSQWLGETNGMYMRQGLCEIYSHNLTKAPISAVQGINPNIMFAEKVNVAPAAGNSGTTDGIVKYDSTYTDFAGGVVAGGAAVTAANNHLTVPQLLWAGDVASQKKFIQPVPIAGKKLYLLYTSREEVRRLRSANVTDSYAEYYLQGSALARVQDIVPQAEMVIGDVIVAVDDRAPTVDLSGAHPTFGYVAQGRADGRATPGADMYNVNILLGANALIEYERAMPDFKTEEDNYTQDQGTLIYECIGYNLTVWDVHPDFRDDDSARNEGSILILTSREESI